LVVVLFTTRVTLALLCIPTTTPKSSYYSNQEKIDKTRAYACFPRNSVIIIIIIIARLVTSAKETKTYTGWLLWGDKAHNYIRRDPLFPPNFPAGNITGKSDICTHTWLVIVFRVLLSLQTTNYHHTVGLPEVGYTIVINIILLFTIIIYRVICSFTTQCVYLWTNVFPRQTVENNASRNKQPLWRTTTAVYFTGSSTRRH